jgi:hypothetical protein
VVHIFLRYRNGGFMNLDGLHSLLAWVIFEKSEEIPAYAVGRLAGADGPSEAAKELENRPG